MPIPARWLTKYFFQRCVTSKHQGTTAGFGCPGFSWLESPIIRSLDEDQASVVLDALVAYPVLEYDAEYIVAAIAERWPALVVAFIGKRLEFSRTDSAPPRYDAVPFSVYELQAPPGRGSRHHGRRRA